MNFFESAYDDEKKQQRLKWNWEERKYHLSWDIKCMQSMFKIGMLRYVVRVKEKKNFFFILQSCSAHILQFVGCCCALLLCSFIFFFSLSFFWFISRQPSQQKQASKLLLWCNKPLIGLSWLMIIKYHDICMVDWLYMCARENAQMYNVFPRSQERSWKLSSNVLLNKIKKEKYFSKLFCCFEKNVPPDVNFREMSLEINVFLIYNNFV